MARNVDGCGGGVVFFLNRDICPCLIDQVLGPLISSLPKSDSNGGDDGALVSATAAAAAGSAGSGTATAGGMNVGGGLSVTPVLALGPNGTQQHILQVIDLNQSRGTMSWLTGDGQKVTAAPMQVTSQLLGEVDSSILASAMQQVTSGDVVDLHETSPSSNSEWSPPSSSLIIYNVYNASVNAV